MRPFLFSALLALAACSQEAAPPPAPEPTRPAIAGATTGGELVASAIGLAGEYRVAGVGGREIDLPYGITAGISRDRIHLTADCINAEWAYHFEDGLLVTERVPAEGCARGLAGEEEALLAAFDGADKVLHLPSGAYEFSGKGPVATLFTQ